jgi:endonuclease/exonuclease/phosphatase family metal-dependent hydrolase
MARWKKRLLLSFVLLLLLLGIWGWWRMGANEIQVDEAALAAQPRPPEGGPVEFSVCTYNIQARPVLDDARHKFQYISPLMNQFDMVGFQECFKEHRLLWAQATHPVKIYHGTLKTPFRVVNSGLSIIARFPLRTVKAINFDAVGEFQNVLASKGVLMASLDVAGMPLDFYTTHMEAGGSPEALVARHGQAAELIAFVKENSPPEHNVIFLGDFNMRLRERPGRTMNDYDREEAEILQRIIDACGFLSASAIINGAIGSEIDHIFFRPGKGHKLSVLSWQKDDPQFYDPAKQPLSDHDPVFSRFRLEREKAAAIPASPTAPGE